MTLTIDVKAETFPIEGTFTISRGAKTEAHVVTVTISDGIHVGRGECVPYGRYGESVESVIREIHEQAESTIARPDRIALQSAMKAGAARNALDCALWDYEAKRLGIPARNSLRVRKPHPIITAYTLSLGTPEEMANAAKAASHRALLKIKVGGDGDIERLRAVVSAAPNSKIILDANEGWNEDNLIANLEAAAALNVALIEQPLPVGKDQILSKIIHAVPICADESAHTSENLAELKKRYDAVNIKLDKTGGLTEAIKMRDQAKALGFKIMVGCMVSTSLAMAPAVFLAQKADFVDLDGPLLLAKDREHGLVYEGSNVHPPERELWG